MKKIILSIYAMILCHSAFSQDMLRGFYLNPLGGNWESYKAMAFGKPDVKWGGLMWNNTNTLFGNGDDFTIYTYSNRDLVLAPGGGNIILNPRNTAGKIGVGISNPNYKLDVNGTVHSKEIKVDLEGWADFVFKDEYTLPRLEDIEKFIAENGHLEYIPTEEEVSKNGVEVGVMLKLLLQKVEELTLHAIKQQNEIEKLKQQNKIHLNN
ncbi:hypothetical protein [Zunongwangia pacifica]|uniref:Peptidase S74 domain-containing protein n=1 Tax=Zunongwangia pacifica TaxID=2911062 RepID=A0A9X2CR32_9FLAO|nr:hypothetical protein [Zunongwangia pacifica]MCL6220757.1 hypothetical protein [Zunongwangia pacifica]